MLKLRNHEQTRSVVVPTGRRLGRWWAACHQDFFFSDFQWSVPFWVKVAKCVFSLPLATFGGTGRTAAIPLCVAVPSHVHSVALGWWPGLRALTVGDACLQYPFTSLIGSRCSKHFFCSYTQFATWFHIYLFVFACFPFSILDHIVDIVYRRTLFNCHFLDLCILKVWHL